MHSERRLPAVFRPYRGPVGDFPGGDPEDVTQQTVRASAGPYDTHYQLLGK